jgi:hypothetical protein
LVECPLPVIEFEFERADFDLRQSELRAQHVSAVAQVTDKSSLDKFYQPVSKRRDGNP